MKGKRILLVDLGGSMGGVESYLEGLAGMLHDRADLFLLCVLPQLARSMRNRQVRVFLCPAFSKPLKVFRFLIALLLLPLIILRYRIQVVQVNGFLEAVLLIPARILGCEAIYTRHGPFEDDLYKWYKSPARFFPRWLSRFCVRFATHVICVSESVGEVVRQIVPTARTTVIPNWVSCIPPYKARPTDGLNREAHLLYVGRLERYKGLHLLLEAMRCIPNARLTVLGDGSYRAQLESLAAGINVRFVGFQPNPEAYYNEADVFLMPSMGPEGLPMVTIEAMAHGLPCLFSDLSVHQEITADGKAGMLFRSGDVEDLRQKLMLLLEKAAIRTTYSQEAYRMVVDRYNPETARVSYLHAFGLDG